MECPHLLALPNNSSYTDTSLRERHEKKQKALQKNRFKLKPILNDF